MENSKKFFCGRRATISIGFFMAVFGGLLVYSVFLGKTNDFFGVILMFTFFSLIVFPLSYFSFRWYEVLEKEITIKYLFGYRTEFFFTKVLGTSFSVCY